MDINVKVTIDASPELKAVLQGFFRPVGMHAVPANEPGATASPAKVRKAEKAAEKTADAPPAAETTAAETSVETVESTGDDNTVAPTVTIEQIRALIPKAKEKVGTDKVKALLTKYNTANVTNLPVSNYDQFYNELKNLAA